MRHVHSIKTIILVNVCLVLVALIVNSIVDLANYYTTVPIMVKTINLFRNTYSFIIGICNIISEKAFNCICDLGWEGIYCESMVNFCNNNTCQNRGICRPLFRNFACQCLGNHYFGRYCEHTSRKIFILQIVSKSFAYISILAISSVALFVIIMDVLKYGFGIDPVETERKKIQRKKRAKKHRPIIQRFTYIT